MAKTQASRNKLAQAIARDPKKAGVLSILVVVLLCMWAKVMMKDKAGPAQAVAAVSAAPKSGKLTLPGDVNDRTHAAMQEWLGGDAAPADRNLFAVKFDFFQQDDSKLYPNLRITPGDGFWDKLAKSMTDQADQKKEQEILVENLRLQAAQLRLQTIMMGAQPKAIINDGLVGEGDVVAKTSFRVLKIEPRRIIVEQKGIKLAILMK